MFLRQHATLDGWGYFAHIFNLQMNLRQRSVFVGIVLKFLILKMNLLHFSRSVFVGTCTSTSGRDKAVKPFSRTRPTQLASSTTYRPTQSSRLWTKLTTWRFSQLWLSPSPTAVWLASSSCSPSCAGKELRWGFRSASLGQTLCSHSVFFLLHTHLHLFTARLIFVTPVQTRTKPVAGSCSWCCCPSSKRWDEFYALPDPSTTFFTLPDPTPLHSARAISTQESVSTTMCSLLEAPIHNRPPMDVSML